MKIKATDFLRWALALILLYFVAWYTVIGVLYTFEFIVGLLHRLRPIFYVMLIFPLISILFALVLMIMGSIVQLIITLSVRQSRALSIVFGILFSLGIITFLILFWLGSIRASWEVLRYSLFNKIVFSLLLGSLLYLPSSIHDAVCEDGRLVK